jgi:glyoxylate carboligase
VRKPEELYGALATALEAAETHRLPVVVDVVTDKTAMAPLAYINET